jgi:AAA domain
LIKRDSRGIVGFTTCAHEYTLPFVAAELIRIEGLGPMFEPSVRMTRADDLQAREIEWLWDDRVPLGMTTLFPGDPKLGKSCVTRAMAAALSGGRSLPVGEVPNKRASTILMSAEDDRSWVIPPRLKAANADLSKVHMLESIVRADRQKRDRSDTGELRKPKYRPA